MSSEKRLLVISYSFPPNSEVGARRVAGLCRYLPAHGVRPVVLTVRQECYKLLDNTIPLPPGLSVERTGLRQTVLALYGRLRAPLARNAGSGGASPAASAGERRKRPSFLRRQLLTLLESPDIHRNWRSPATKAGGKLLKSGQFDAIFSSGPPWTAHLIARGLKKKYRLPWLADFRDPWASASAPGLPRWRRSLDAYLEAGCIRSADLVICNTDALKQNFIARYPSLDAGKFFTITNGFEDALAGSAPAAHGATPMLLHLGSLYGQRRIDTFCLAVERLLSGGAVGPGAFKILFVGDTGDAFLRAAAQFAPQALQTGAIEFRSAVPWVSAQELLRGACMLLIFQGSHRMQVPAKFYEYLQTGKPIFAVAEEGALTGLLEATESGIWADPSDASDIAAKFLRALSLKSRAPEDVEQRWAGKYHYRELARNLAERIRALAG